MSHRFTRGPLAFVLAVALAAAPLPVVSLAHAEPSAADIETARALYKEGLDLRKGGDESGALQKFKGGYALTKSPVIGLEVAKSEAATGKLVDAREQALEVDALPTTAKETKASVDARAEARTLAADLKARIPSLKIRLVDVPYDTKPNVTVDGASVPFEVLGEARAVDPGKHVVAASIGSEPPATKEITVAEGESPDVTLSLAGHAGATSGGAMPMPTSGATMVPTTTTSSLGSTTTKKDSGTNGGKTSPLVWIGAGLMTVGVVVGTTTGVMALSKASTVKNECPNSTCPSSASSDLDYVKTTAAISTVSFAAAGAGVVLLVIGLSSKSKTESAATPSTTASITPWIGLGSAGVSGAF